jgi:hypothetical protein
MAELSPREIQTRVRAGEKPEDLAEQFGVPLDSVLRFAESVLQERDRVTFEARRGRARLNGDGAFVEFGDAVDARFDAYGVDPAGVTWDSRRRADGQWVITATWIVSLDAADDHCAQWSLSLGNRTLSPLDSTASDLLSDRPITPVTEESAFDLTADELAAADEAQRPVIAVTAQTAPGVAAFPARPDAITGPLPGVTEQVFDQTMFDDPSADAPPAEPAATPAALPFDLEPRDLEPLEPLVLEPPDVQPEESTTAAAPVSNVHNLGVARRAAQDAAAEVPPKAPDEQITAANPYLDESESRSTRARIPSWDDILLGVRRKSD